MHKFFLKIPWWVRKIYPDYVWKGPANGKVVYLTFDDGPHPAITPWVLDQLRQYGAKASFFCIGKNVEQHPGVYKQILDAGHSVGNHTFSHLNGWKTGNEDYLQDIEKAGPFIDTTLFRPPYGRLKGVQAKGMAKAMQKPSVKIVMWDVLSADFDASISPAACAGIVIKHVQPGSVVVFHDSEKAFRNLEYALPKVLATLAQQGYKFEKL